MTDLVVSRRERKKEETRRRIFKAAVTLFRQRGFGATTVDDITERADVAKGTFFNYFPRKDAVLAYLSEERLLVLEENAEAILAAEKPAREKLIEVYALAASAYEEDRELSRYVLNELMARAFAPSEEGSLDQRWRTLIGRVFAQGKAAAEFKPDLDFRRVESVLTGVYYALIYTWVNCLDADFALQSELRAQFTMVFEGLAA
jgi:AcrR family transcriptional regulator